MSEQDACQRRASPRISDLWFNAPRPGVTSCVTRRHNGHNDDTSHEPAGNHRPPRQRGRVSGEHAAGARIRRRTRHQVRRVRRAAHGRQGAGRVPRLGTRAGRRPRRQRARTHLGATLRNAGGRDQALRAPFRLHLSTIALAGGGRDARLGGRDGLRRGEARQPAQVRPRNRAAPGGRGPETGRPPLRADLVRPAEPQGAAHDDRRPHRLGHLRVQRRHARRGGGACARVHVRLHGYEESRRQW